MKLESRKYTKDAAVKEAKTWKRLTENEYQHLNIKKLCYDQIIYGLDRVDDKGSLTRIQRDQDIKNTVRKKYS